MQCFSPARGVRGYPYPEAHVGVAELLAGVSRPPAVSDPTPDPRSEFAPARCSRLCRRSARARSNSSYLRKAPSRLAAELASPRNFSKSRFLLKKLDCMGQGKERFQGFGFVKKKPETFQTDCRVPRAPGHSHDVSATPRAKFTARGKTTQQHLLHYRYLGL